MLAVNSVNFEKQRQTMKTEAVPYLCGGTFLCQVLRARNELKTSTEHTKCQKETLTEQETFRRLISIYQLNDFFSNTSLKTYTSRYKACGDSLLAYAQFMDSDLRLEFDNAVKTGDPKILHMMSDFVREFINVKEKGVQLVRSLLGMIKDDRSILENDEFYIKQGKALTKKELLKLDNFTVEYFLLGVWHYIIMNRADKNKNGKDTYYSWYPSRGKYCGTVGNDIKKNITVDSIPALLSTTEEKNAVLVMPSKASASATNACCETDKVLLQEFTEDYDDLVLKCIGANYAEYIISEPVSKKIKDLYNKWSTKADEFQSLSLKPSIWSLLGHLNELSEILDDDGTDSVGPDLHTIQLKLRNLYVKLHPDDYANSFLYDAIYDDWNQGEDC